MRDLGDSVMTLAICALFGKQPMTLVDAARMRLQETDRIKAMVMELQRVGARAEEHQDGFTVWPAEPELLRGADIETYNDHRMAMCFSVLGLKVPGIRIKNPSCVNKTFPNFFDKLEQLRR
jgi:3-phosphoshikimate 1-carboxyvinyltransferase